MRNNSIHRFGVVFVIGNKMSEQNPVSQSNIMLTYGLLVFIWATTPLAIVWSVQDLHLMWALVI